MIVLGTSSSESALPQLMEKLERLGCSKPVVGLVVPTGYSFNLDGTNIYMTLGDAVHRASARHRSVVRPATDHPGRRDADLEGRKRRHRRGLHHAGGDAVGRRSGAGAGHGDRVRDRQVHERGAALTNIIGNGVATVFVSWWEGELDHEKLHANLNQADRSRPTWRRRSRRGSSGTLKGTWSASGTADRCQFLQIVSTSQSRGRPNQIDSSGLRTMSSDNLCETSSVNGPNSDRLPASGTWFRL